MAGEVILISCDIDVRDNQDVKWASEGVGSLFIDFSISCLEVGPIYSRVQTRCTIWVSKTKAGGQKENVGGILMSSGMATWFTYQLSTS